MTNMYVQEHMLVIIHNTTNCNDYLQKWDTHTKDNKGKQKNKCKRQIFNIGNWILIENTVNTFKHDKLNTVK